MPRTHVIVSRGRARALVAQLAAARGYPRCVCPAHGGGAVAGISPPCPCASATQTHPQCPHVVRWHVRAQRHPSDAARWALPVDAAVEAALTPAERAGKGALPAEWRPPPGQALPDDEA